MSADDTVRSGEKRRLTDRSRATRRRQSACRWQLRDDRTDCPSSGFRRRRTCPGSTSRTSLRKRLRRQGDGLLDSERVESKARAGRTLFDPTKALLEGKVEDGREELRDTERVGLVAREASRFVNESRVKGTAHADRGGEYRAVAVE